MAGGAANAGGLSWTLVADQTVVSTSSETLTRSLRGLALNDDATLLYGGFIQKSEGASAREYTLAGDPPVGTINASFNVTGIAPSGANHQPKAVALDDRGFVFVGSSKDSTSGDNARLFILPPGLATFQLFVLDDIDFPGVTGERIDGLHVRRVGDDYFVYTSRRHPNSAYVERYLLTGNAVGSFGLSLDTTFNGTGRYNLRTDGGFPAAGDLHGLTVAADGTIFVASRAGGLLYRIPADLTTASTVALNQPMDVAVFGDSAFVTLYDGNSSAIAEVDVATMTVVSTFDAFGDFPRDAGATGNVAGYSGIHIDAGGHIWLADQLYFEDSAERRDRVLRSSPLPSPIPDLTITVALGGMIDPGPFDRCVELQFGCGGPVESITMTFTGGVAMATIPMPSGDPDCATARDPKHTLRSLAPIVADGGDFTIGFVGSAALRGGNLNGDGFIDIIDYAIFAAAFSSSPGADTPCGHFGTHADLSGDGVVNLTDFSFFQINFLQFDDDCCGSPLPGPLASNSPDKSRSRPRERIRVDELRDLGIENADRADRNRDGWVDAVDIALFMTGH